MWGGGGGEEGVGEQCYYDHGSFQSAALSNYCSTYQGIVSFHKKVIFTSTQDNVNYCL